MFGEAMLSRGPGPEPLTKLNRLGFQTADAPLGKPAIRMKLCALLYLLAVIRGKKKALGVGLQVQHLHSSFTFISTFFPVSIFFALASNHSARLLTKSICPNSRYWKYWRAEEDTIILAIFPLIWIRPRLRFRQSKT
jgi:hypothetical protein